MEGSVVFSAVRGREREMVRDGRNFKRTDSDTQEKIHLSKVGKRKESI